METTGWGGGGGGVGTGGEKQSEERQMRGEQTGAQWSLKSEQTLISLCPPAWLTLTPNGIHVLCLSLATVEESTTLVAVHCQEGQDEALPFSVFLKIASCATAISVCTNLNLLLLLLPDTVPHGSSDLHTQMWKPHKPTVNEREGKESERKKEREGQIEKTATEED
ncbi:hypothetical protein NQZ68_026066 [Dissostichus eleginoides]|nr:hypothetical protein NQZ68_026066 [Dissostichus eleginoides]